jgi:hypothetical protein
MDEPNFIIPPSDWQPPSFGPVAPPNRHQRRAARSTKKPTPVVYDPGASPFKGALYIPLPNYAKRRIRHKH